MIPIELLDGEESESKEDEECDSVGLMGCGVLDVSGESSKEEMGRKSLKGRIKLNLGRGFSVSVSVI